MLSLFRQFLGDGWVFKKTPLKKNNHNHHDEMEWLSKRAQGVAPTLGLLLLTAQRLTVSHDR